MEKTYRVSVNGNYNFEITESELKAIDAVELSPTESHILYNDQSLTADITDSDFLKRRYGIEINSNVYDVTILNDLDLRIKEMGLTLKSSKAVNEVKAPMPGLILEVNVEVGQEVKQGEYLLVLEAMKMENALVAPRDAVIKEISVEKGQTVNKNHLLVKID